MSTQRGQPHFTQGEAPVSGLSRDMARQLLKAGIAT